MSRVGSIRFNSVVLATFINPAPPLISSVSSLASLHSIREFSISRKVMDLKNDIPSLKLNDGTSIPMAGCPKSI